MLMADAREITIGAQGLEAIAQNVRMILTTPKGSVPLDRDFGVSWMVVDRPSPKARAELVAEIFDQVRRYEPRVRVTEIDWQETGADNMDGRLRPSVRLEILS
jgi:hypothetical protein